MRSSLIIILVMFPGCVATSAKVQAEKSEMTQAVVAISQRIDNMENRAVSVTKETYEFQKARSINNGMKEWGIMGVVAIGYFHDNVDRWCKRRRRRAIKENI